MWNSRTDKWHSQNGYQTHCRCDWCLPAKLRVRSTDKRAVMRFEDIADAPQAAATALPGLKRVKAAGQARRDAEMWCQVGHTLIEHSLLDCGCKRMKCLWCAHMEDLHPLIYGCEKTRNRSAQQKEDGTMQHTAVEVYQGIGEQVDIDVVEPKRPTVDRKRIELLLSKMQPLPRAGNNPYSRPTEDIRLFDSDSRTRKGMKVG